MVKVRDEDQVRDNGSSVAPLVKSPTGIRGFDDISGGGLPRGRATLVTGAAGAGKTLFGLEFLVRGATDFGEPGVLMAFEETADELSTNVASLGFDLPRLAEEGLLVVDTFQIDAANVVATGDFDLTGLFIRLASAVEAVGAKRIVLDTIEVLFSTLGHEAIVRSELSRILRWLKDRGLTVVITGERGRSGQLTRFGIEEYISDCVVVLDHRIDEEVSTRRLRIAKYRGSLHGTNEYPFLVTDRGLEIMPLSSMTLDFDVSSVRSSTGIPRLDHMLGGGVYRGSTVMLTGTAGSGKTNLAAHTADAACANGERVLFMSYEESPAQILRNVSSIGIDLQQWSDSGLLRLWSGRPGSMGLEAHLVQLVRLIEETRPSLVVLDGLGSLSHVGKESEVTSAVTRQTDLLKSRGVTALLTGLTHDGDGEASVLEISSLVDTWLLLRNTELDGERSRLICVVKNRGSAHSNQVREFVLTNEGAQLLDVYVGPDGVLVGGARLSQQAKDGALTAAGAAELARKRAAFAGRTAQVQQQISMLNEALSAEEAALVVVEAGVAQVAASELRQQAALAEDGDRVRHLNPQQETTS